MAGNESPPPDSSYFSIKLFIKDQINTYYRIPFSLYRVSHLNGETDSTLVNFLTMDWAAILGTFSATDISPRKYLGTYSYSEYDDNVTGSRGHTYTATDPKAFTRQLQINSDPFTDKITSIYIETAKRDFWGSKTQKLLYIPMRVIQIQEREGNLLSKDKDLRIDYRFMQEDVIDDEF